MKKLTAFLAAACITAILSTGTPQASAQDATPTPAPATEATPAPVSPEKRAEIERMLKLTGSEKLITQMMTTMIQNIKSRSTEKRAEFWDKFEQKLDAHAMIEKMIPLYDKYYTLEDLKAINAFYESPVGQKVISTRPMLMQESMKAGQELGQKIITQIQAEMKQEQAGDKKQ